MKMIRIFSVMLMASCLSCAECENVAQSVSEEVMDADDTLLEAVMFGKPDLETVLNDSQIMSLVSDDGVGYALIRAAYDGNYAIIKKMVGCDKIISEIASRKHNTAFLWAANNGGVDVIKLFSDSSIVDKVLTMEDVSSAIWYACDKGQHLVIREILNNSATSKLINAESLNISLGLAVYKQHDLVIQELLGNNDIVSMITRRNADKVLRWASVLGNLQMIKTMFASYNFCKKLSPDGLEKALNYAKSDEVRTLLFYKSWRGMRNGVALNKNKQELLSSIVAGDGKPSVALLRILEKIYLQHDGTMKDIAEKFQQFKLNSYDETLFADKFDELRLLFNELGMVDSFEYHEKNNYKYAIVSCGWVSTVQSRLSYLAKWWDDGIRFEKIVFLVVDKALDPVNDSIEFMKTPYYKHLPFKRDWTLDESMPYETYLDMMQLVWKAFDFPSEMKDLPVEFVMVSEWETGLALKNWLATFNPEPGDILFVGNQPYCAAGLVCAKNVLPADFKVVDFVGYGIHPRFERVGLWLGALSWWLREAYLVPQK